VAGDRILGGVEEIEQEFLALVAGLAAGGNAPHPKDHSQGTPPPVRDTARTAVPATDSIYLAFVTDARCAKCGRAEYMLKALQARYPNLAVRRFDLQSASDKPMIEALGLLYGVEPGQRLLAPAAYVGDDKLLADQVDDQALAALLEKYKAGTSRVPWRDAQPYLAAAEQGILDRFRHFGLLGVAAAGLLDGINPCSFAVLVFFISYLAFTGRRRWEILAVGVAYTLADFLVYFLIGVGGLSFLMGLKALPAVSRVFYWIAFAAGLVLAVYNFRDFLKARRGDLSGMDLQLSTAAKQRVHRVIRERIGAGGLITGAFITGLITSVLEFACTGQVYLPTIAFVAQIAPLRAQAYGYLLLYNLMFEVPMIATFVIAFWGVSSKAIGDWARRSVPAVKLATALLFLGMSAVLLLVLAG
jgi:cytochrome c biogenesis protein CcdA